MSDRAGPVVVQAHILRLKAGEDVKKSLDAYAAAHGIHAGVIATAVGSLREAKLRLAMQPSATTMAGPFEVTSLTGTLSPDGSHLHAGMADRAGQAVGGHVVEGCLVGTTLEVVILELSDITFGRRVDPVTGFPELVIRP